MFNINTAGNISVNGGSLNTTATIANLFNTGATTLNIGGAASTINIGATGGTTLISNGALTINSKNGSALTIDSESTGAIRIGTGVNAKAILIGNTNASTTLSIHGGVTWSINNAGDLTTAGNISTTDSGTITSDGLLTANNGLTVLSGGVSLPAGSIINNALANPSLTVTAGIGMSGGGSVALGGTTTLNLSNVGTSGTYGSSSNIPVFTTDAQGRITNVTNTAFTVDNINGATLGVTTATAGNLLIGDTNGTSWVSRAMSGDATINSLGGIALNYAAGQAADGTHKGFLTAADWLTFNGKQNVLGYTAENNLNKSTDTTLTVGGTSSDTLYPSQKAVKTYVDGIETGLKWVDPLEFIVVIANTATPVLTPADRDTYIIETGGNTGPWAAFSAGDAVQYQTDHWVFIKAMAVGDRFGIGYQSPTTPYNSMAGKSNYLGVISAGTTGAFSYTFTAPANNDAVFIKNNDDYYHDIAFTYSSTLSRWIQFSASAAYTFNNGFSTIGTNIALGGLTADWNQTGVFNINTAGNISVNGGSLNTTATIANLFNTGATTLNIGGAASTINIGATGGTTLISNGALTINSKNGSALTIDSESTGAIRIGTGVNAKAILIGNTNASTTLSIHGGVTWSINNAGDLTTAGNISTTDSGTITSDGLLTANNGLTVLSGGVSLPAGSIINNALANPSLTVTAGIGMSGGGSVALGGTTTLGVRLTTTGTIGTTASNSGLEVSASGLTLLKGCNDGQILKYTDAGGWACQDDLVSGIRTLNGVTAAIGTNTINSGDYEQVWNWSMTSASKTAFTIGESTPSTNGTGSQYLFGISTAAGSTAAPLKVSAQGNIILDTTSAGGITMGNTTANSQITLQSGTGGINIGTDANTKTISIGTTTGSTTLNLISGTGGINIGTAIIDKNINIGTGGANNVISIGTTSGTSSLNLWAGSGGINIGSGATAKTINIGNGAAAITMLIGSTNTTSVTTIQSGSGGINIGTGAVAKTISIGTGAAANTLVIGSTNTTSATTIQSGSGNITFAVDGTNSSGKVIIGNSGTTAPDLLVLDNGTTDPVGTNGATYYNSSTNKFRCYENSAWIDCVTSEIQKTRSFGDTSVTTFANNNTTTIFIGATRPNITPSSASSKILVMVSVGLSTPGTGSDTPIGTIRRGIGATPVCDNGHTGQVDSFFGRYSTDAVSYTATNTFLDNPATTSTVYYTLCTDSTSVMADTVSKTSAYITLIEVNNSTADLAEIYSTMDKTIGTGDVVVLDTNLKSGVKKSTKGYDESLIGVVSSNPALVMGSVDDDEASGVPVALSGRVPVKVNTDGGEIKVGDPLTSSSTPGVAMKATKAGVIIGTAMSDFNGEGTGQVLVFIKNGSGMEQNSGFIARGG